jgi:hypothetical protein
MTIQSDIVDAVPALELVPNEYSQRANRDARRPVYRLRS